MKKQNKYKLSVVLLFSLLVSSCQSFLELPPVDFVAPENFYNTEKEADQALAGVYQTLNTVYASPFKSQMNLVGDEILYTRLGGAVVPEHLLNSTTTLIADCWNNLYKGIYNANLFLENVDKVSGITAEKRESLRSEALFLRSVFYYHLTLLWKDVPLRLEAAKSPIGTACAKTSQAAIFDRIVTDMGYAVKHLYPYAKQKGAPVRICKEGATGFLARVYLSMAGFPLNDPTAYQKARDLLLPLVNSKAIRLNPDYTQIWKNISADAFDHNCKEILFDVEYSGVVSMYIGGGWAGNGAPGAPASDSEAKGYNLDWFRVCISLWEAYQSDVFDVRYSWNICNYKIDGNGNTVLKPAYTANGSNVSERNAGKFRRDWEVIQPRDKNNNGSNLPLLRYSDVLLMLAEAENEINGPTQIAYDAIDSVRYRANATLFINTKPTMNKEEFREEIKRERSRELCFEGMIRYFDLLRWGDLESSQRELSLKYQAFGGNTNVNLATKLYDSFKSYMIWFPIPMSEMQLNPLIKENNPGW